MFVWRGRTHLPARLRRGQQMKLGVATVVTDEGIRPDVLAKALEDRGFDSLMVAEHSHIRESGHAFPAGGELPREYYRSTTRSSR